MVSFEGHLRARGDFESPRLSQTVEPTKGNVWAADRQKTVVIMASYIIPYHHSKKKDKRWGNETSGNKETTARRAQHTNPYTVHSQQQLLGVPPWIIYIYIYIPNFAVCVVYVLKMGLTRCSFPFSLYSPKSKKKEGRSFHPPSISKPI